MASIKIGNYLKEEIISGKDKNPHAQRGKVIEGMESHYNQIKQSRFFQSLDGNKNRLMEMMMDVIRREYKDIFIF